MCENKNSASNVFHYESQQEREKFVKQKLPWSFSMSRLLLWVSTLLKLVRLFKKSERLFTAYLPSHLHKLILKLPCLISILLFTHLCTCTPQSTGHPPTHCVLFGLLPPATSAPTFPHNQLTSFSLIHPHGLTCYPFSCPLILQSSACNPSTYPSIT